jgi:abhydrolase domain-containing protein 8
MSLLIYNFRIHSEYFYAARGKQLVFDKDGTSEVPAYVLENVRQGQTWPQGDSAFHRRIQVPTLLVHGISDPYITLVEECEMERVRQHFFLLSLLKFTEMLIKLF